MRAEEGPAGFDIAGLPLLVLADAPALALIFLGIGLFLLELDEAAEWVEQVLGQAEEHLAVQTVAVGEEQRIAADAGKRGDGGHPPAKQQDPQDVDEEQDGADAPAWFRVDVALGGALDGPALLVEGGFPDPDTEGMGFVDRLLPILDESPGVRVRRRKAGNDGQGQTVP